MHDDLFSKSGLLKGTAYLVEMGNGGTLLYNFFILMSANRSGQWTLVPSILHTQIATVKISVLRIHDILVWIRIRRSMPLTNGSGSGFGSGSWILDPDPAIFVIDLQDARKKLIFLNNFSVYYFLKVHLHYFSKMKIKTSHKIVGFKGFLTIA
jgi:hypothetical protein